jgi:hypothetical protein
MNNEKLKYSNKVGGGDAFWKFSSGVGVAAAWEVSLMLCTMRRPQGLSGHKKI